MRTSECFFGAIALIALLSVFFSGCVESGFEKVSKEQIALLKENKFDYESLSSAEAFAEVDEDTAKSVIAELQTFSNSDNKPIAESSNVLISIVEEALLRKELLNSKQQLLALSDEDECSEYDLMAQAFEQNKAVYEKVLENNLAITAFITNFPEENKKIELNKYLADEQQVFDDYYDLQSYLLTAMNECLSLEETGETEGAKETEGVGENE